MQSPLGARLGRAAYTAGGLEIASRSLTVIVSIQAARTLEPEQLGELGLAVIIIGTLSVIVSSTDTACVAVRSGMTDAAYALAAVVIRGLLTATSLALALTILPVASSILTSDPHSQAEVMGLTAMLAWQPILEIVGTYPRVLLRRRLDFMPVMAAGLVQVATHAALSIVFLYAGYGVKGMVWAVLIATTTSSLALWLRFASRPGRSWPGRVTRGLWRESGVATIKMLAANSVSYFGARVDSLLVSASLGPAAMSFYGMAWNSSRLPLAVLSQALDSVLVPALSRLGNDVDRTGRLLRGSLRQAYTVLTPVAAVMFVTAPFCVRTILGPKWEPVVPLVRIMSITILIGPLLTIANATLIVNGRGHWLGVGSGIRPVALAVILVPFVRNWGLVGAAFADMFSAGAVTLVLYSLASVTRSDLRWEWVHAMTVPVIAAVAGGLIAFVVGERMVESVTRFVIETALLTGTYSVAVTLLGGHARLAEVGTGVRDLFHGPRLSPVND